MKIPRPNTKVRAVFDLLSDGKVHSWKKANDAYCAAGQWRTNTNYVGMELTRVLKKYANRITRGVWQMKREYFQAVMDEKVIARADHLKTLSPDGCGGDPSVVDEYPHGRKFKPGDRVRYTGGYSHYTVYGVPTGTEFTVDFYGDGRDSAGEAKPVNGWKGWLYFKEAPIGGSQKGGHGDNYFELVRKTDPIFSVKIDKELKDHGACPIPVIQSGSFTTDPTIADMAWGSTRIAQAPEVKHDCSGCHEDCISEEMHMDAMMHKDNEIKQLTEIADRYQEECASLEQDNAGLWEDLEARKVVIKNQLEWINRLDAALKKANDKLHKIMDIVEEA